MKRKEGTTDRHAVIIHLIFATLQSMDVTFTLTNLFAMLGAMLVLASVPDASTFAVVARAMTSGFLHGVVTTLGIITGDFIFIIIVMYGLAFVAESMSGVFTAIKFLGGLYLLWSGYCLWRTHSQARTVEEIQEPSWSANFTTGLLITLGDPKAILFYISFLPAFINLTHATMTDTALVMFCATLSVSIFKLSYALMADKSRRLFKNIQARRYFNLAAAGVMLLTAMYLLITTLVDV